MEGVEHAHEDNCNTHGHLPGMANQLVVQGITATYGHLVTLGRDCYGVASTPICQGTTGTDRTQRFNQALGSLSNGGDATALQKIIDLIDGEMNPLAPAISHPMPTGASDLYKSGAGMGNFWPTLYTMGTYISLSAMNFDHFG